MTMSISIEEEITNLMKEGWNKVQATIHTQIALELRKETGGLRNTIYENRYRERMHRYRR